MDIAQTVPALDAALLAFRQNRRDAPSARAARASDIRPRIAFVPTMGALHDGHLALVAHARTLAGPGGAVVASVFVNPTQFDRADDLAAYPRHHDRDAALLRDAGADVLFLPSEAVIYPADYKRSPTPDLLGLDTRFEGARRPGHFDGVVEVVRRLVHVVRPDVMVMGRKDAQQLAILRRAAEVEAWPVDIVGHDTVRAGSGLALSSRNARLSEAGLAVAPTLHAALVETARAVGEGADPDEAAAASRRVLAKAGLEVEYLEVVRARDFVPVETCAPGEEVLVVAAAWLEGVRLIDNVGAVCGLRPPAV